MGIYAKGRFGRVDYRVAINNPLNPANAIGAGGDFGGQSNLTYNGSAIAEGGGDPVGNMILEGHFNYSFFDKESIKLPYRVGTFFGQKKILNVGIGFYAHPNGMYNNVDSVHSNVFHFAADVFYDQPVGKNDGLNAYASVIRFNYGEDYMSRWVGTGTNLFGQVGYYIGNLKLMPYIAYQTGIYDAYADNLNALDIGVNYLLSGHNAKLTLEYHRIANNPSEGELDPVTGQLLNLNQMRLQLHIFL
jgi:hypothetical protein